MMRLDVRTAGGNSQPTEEDMMTNTRAVTMLAAVAVAAGSMALMSNGAEARRGGASVVEWSFQTPGPQRGYSGFVPSGGPRSVYCDYQRIPNRKCTVDRKGRERCRIVNWTLKQACY